MNAFHLNYMLRAVFFVHTKKCKGKISKFDLSSHLLEKYSTSYKYKKQHSFWDNIDRVFPKLQVVVENKPPKAALSRGSRAKFIDNKLLSIELLISKKEHSPYFLLPNGGSTQLVLRDCFFRSLSIWFSLRNYIIFQRNAQHIFFKNYLF